jgi:hypothetical protein
MYCNSCGHQRTPYDTFCGRCGVDLTHNAYKVSGDDSANSYNNNAQPYNVQQSYSVQQSYNAQQPYNAQPYNTQPYNAQQYKKQSYTIRPHTMEPARMHPYAVPSSAGGNPGQVNNSSNIFLIVGIILFSVVIFCTAGFLLANSGIFGNYSSVLDPDSENENKGNGSNNNSNNNSNIVIPPGFQRVGTPENGYINLPKSWIKYNDLDSVTYYNRDGSESVVLAAADNYSSVGVEDFAGFIKSSMEKEGIQDIKSESVKVGEDNYTAYKFSGYYNYEDDYGDEIYWISVWCFDTGYGGLHCIEIESPDRNSEVFQYVDSFSFYDQEESINF